MKAHYRELLEFRLDVISMIPADYIGYVLHNKWFVAFRILRFERKGRLGMISYTKFPLHHYKNYKNLVLNIHTGKFFQPSKLNFRKANLSIGQKHGQRFQTHFE